MGRTPRSDNPVPFSCWTRTAHHRATKTRRLTRDANTVASASWCDVLATSCGAWHVTPWRSENTVASVAPSAASYVISLISNAPQLQAPAQLAFRPVGLGLTIAGFNCDDTFLTTWQLGPSKVTNASHAQSLQHFLRECPTRTNESRFQSSATG